MISTSTDIRLWAKVFDHLIILHLSSVYPIKFLLLQTVIIEISLYCYDKLANFGTNTYKPELYLLLFGCLYLV